MAKIGRFCHVFADQHIALGSAALLRRRDVAIAVSHSGMTAETPVATREARSHRATSIAITRRSG